MRLLRASQQYHAALNPAVMNKITTPESGTATAA
jgi:hypothetical protein